MRERPFFLNKDGQYDQQVSIDFGARRLLIGSRRSGVRYFWIFDLDEALALPLKKMTATVTVGSAGSEPVTREIEARDLNDCRVLGGFSVPAGSDKENDVYSYSHQGHEVAGNYVYFYEGNAVETAPIRSNRKPMSRSSTTAARSSCRVPKWRPSPTRRDLPPRDLRPRLCRGREPEGA